MKRTLSRAIIAILAVGLLAGCAQTGISKRTGGAVLGGIAGGVIGSQIGSGSGRIIAAITGTMIGALIGSEIGRRLDERDKKMMAQATQDTLEKSPSGKKTTWRNPDTGHTGTVVAKPAVAKSGGQVCRQFTQTITVEGKTETATGTACRNPDGTWRIVN